MSGRPLTPAQQVTLDEVDVAAWRAGRTMSHVAGERLTLTIQGPALALGLGAITGRIGRRGGLVLEDAHGSHRGAAAYQLLRMLARTRRAS